MRPHLCCTVPDCGRSRATQDPRLPLCGLHLTALERHCKGKHRLAGVRLARREIDRLTAARLDRTGDQVEPRAYRCELCLNWHVGHIVPDSPSEQAAAEAANALRIALTGDQFAELVASWRPGHAPRTTREARQP